MAIKSYGSITITDLTDKSISNITSYYKISENSSGESYDSSWSTTPELPTTEKPYLWQYQVTAYTDSTSTSLGPLVIGTKGSNGTNGEDGYNTATAYLYSRTTSSISGFGNLTYSFTTHKIISALPTGWSDTIPSATSGGGPVWVTAATVSSTTDTDVIAPQDWASPVKLAENGTSGSDGRGITNTVVEYTESTDNTTPPTSGWQSTIPSVEPNNYLWTRVTYTYSDNSTSASYTVARQGANGSQGEQGEAGRGISSTSIKYAESTSGTSAPTDETQWNTTIPEIAEGHFLWTRTIDTYTDNTTTTSYSVAQRGVSGTNGTNGLNTATIYLYQRSSSASIAAPTGGQTYTFSTGNLAPVPTGWSRTIPNDSADPIWMTFSTALSNTTTDTIDSWATPTIMSKNGQDGQDAANYYIDLSLDSVASGHLTGTLYRQGESYSNSYYLDVKYLPINGTSYITDSDHSIVYNTASFSWTRANVKAYLIKAYTDNTKTELLTSNNLIAGTDGAPGQPGGDGVAYTVFLTNENYQFSGNTDTAITGQTAKTVINAYKNDSIISTITINSIDGVTGPFSRTSILNGKMFVSTNGNEITFESASGLSGSGAIAINLTIDGKTIIKYWNYSVSLVGQAGQASARYYLLSNTSSVKKESINNAYEPSSITINAYQAIGQEQVTSAYAQGTLTIQYSTDGSTYETATEQSSVSTITYNIDSSLKIKSFKVLLKHGSSILDSQTIPVLQNIDGLVIGGENILLNTQYFKSKWNATGWTIKAADTNSYLEYDSNSYVNNDKVINNFVDFLPEYAASNLIFSLWIKKIGTISDLKYTIKSYKADKTTLVDTQTVQLISSNAVTGQVEIYEGSLQNNEWCRLVSKVDTHEIPTTAAYFTLEIFAQSGASVHVNIKSLKLEKGTIPTAWNINSADITYESIAGVNLLTNSLQTIIDRNVGYFIDYEINTTPYSNYTLSWETYESSMGLTSWTVSNNNSAIASGSITSDVKSVTFNIGNNSTAVLRIYAGDSTSIDETRYSIFTYLKLEVGSIATEFILTPNQINDIAASQANKATSSIWSTIQTADGQMIFLSKSDFDSYVAQNLTPKFNIIDSVNGQITDINSALTATDEQLQLIQGTIVRDVSTASDPTLTIKADVGEQTQYLQLHKDKLEFYNNSAVVATLSNQQLEITRAVINDSINLGGLKIKITDNGVGFTW